MIVFGAPNRYVQGPDLLDQLPAECARLGNRPVVVIDATVRDLYDARLRESFAQAKIPYAPILFAGEVTTTEIDRLHAEVSASKPDLVVTIGGGKTIDAGKGLRAKLDARLITVPTVASNDSPTSHILVVYDENHRLQGVSKMRANPDTVLVDTRVIANAPVKLFSAGIGDAIVKKYEVEHCINAGGLNVFGARPPLTALAIANACHATLVADASAAIRAVDAHAPDAALERVIEATVLMSGLAFESGGLSISHAMTRGLTAVNGPAQAFHGHQVAYGLLVQFELDGRPDPFMAEMLAFYADTRLPAGLVDLGILAPTATDFAAIAAPSAAAPHTKHFSRPLAVGDIIAAMQRVEARRARLTRPVTRAT